MKVKEMLQKALREMGADGLYCGWCECGCSIDELGLCDSVDIENCEPARSGKDGLYYPMEAK